MRWHLALPFVPPAPLRLDVLCIPCPETKFVRVLSSLQVACEPGSRSGLVTEGDGSARRVTCVYLYRQASNLCCRVLILSSNQRSISKERRKNECWLCSCPVSEFLVFTCEGIHQ